VPPALVVAKSAKCRSIAAATIRNDWPSNESAPGKGPPPCARICHHHPNSRVSQSSAAATPSPVVPQQP
jgi:hypothetical protein